MARHTKGGTVITKKMNLQMALDYLAELQYAMITSTRKRELLLTARLALIRCLADIEAEEAK